MGKGLAIAITAGILITCAPIWRGAGHSRYDGVSFWQLLRDSTKTLKESPFGHPHITYVEAKTRARLAFQEHCNG